MERSPLCKRRDLVVSKLSSLSSTSSLLAGAPRSMDGWALPPEDDKPDVAWR
jgi:hypothetical protein